MPTTLHARRRRRLLAAALTSLLVAAWGCGRDTITGPPRPDALTPSLEQAPAPPPPSLQGELFQSAAPTTYRQSGNCQTNNTVTLSFFTRGAATGPYPGTFVEAGRWTVTYAGQAPARVATAATFNAGFTIFSPTGFVVGTKSSGSTAFPPDFLALVFVCGAAGEVNPAAAVGGYSLNGPYTAAIRTAAGSFRDSGIYGAAFSSTVATGNPFPSL